MAAKANEKKRKPIALGGSSDIGEDESAHRAAGMAQSTLPNGAGSTAMLKIQADNAISDFFDANGLAYNVVDSHFFWIMIRDIVKAGSSYRVPGRRTLGGSILERMYGHDISEKDRLLTLPGVQKFGMSLTTDGATIQKHAMLNCLGVSVAFPSIMLMKVIDATAHLAKGLSKDAEYVADEIIPVIRGLPEPKDVDLIVCDGASDMNKFRRLIVTVFKWILSMWCVSHLVNRILAKIGEIEHVAELIRKGKLIVDTFGGSKHFEHALFEEKCQRLLKKRRALIRYFVTRFGLFFVMLHRLFQLRDVLISCVTCAEWISRFPDGRDETADEVKAIIMDAQFWTNVEKLIVVVWPLLQLLRLGDCDKPSLYTIYKASKSTESRLSELNDEGHVEYMDEVVGAFEQYSPNLYSDAAKVNRFSLCSSKFLNGYTTYVLVSDCGFV